MGQRQFCHVTLLQDYRFFDSLKKRVQATAGSARSYLVPAASHA